MHAEGLFVGDANGGYGPKDGKLTGSGLLKTGDAWKTTGFTIEGRAWASAEANDIMYCNDTRADTTRIRKDIWKYSSWLFIFSKSGEKKDRTNWKFKVRVSANR